MLHPDLLSGLSAALPEEALLTEASAIAPYLTEWRGNYHGQSALVIRPATTAELVTAVRLCHQYRTPMIAQGGNTGLVGGSVGSIASIVINLGRINRIRAIGGAADYLIAEAGVTLQAIQAAAADAERLFPLRLASEGSCTIGGTLSTNAGGTAVLRYGMMRDLTLGLEIVLADGRMLDLLRPLRKNNTGYDLKQLFIGAEGTLGFITAATLKLFAAPKASATAWIGLDNILSVPSLYAALSQAFESSLTGFELINRLSLDLVLAMPGAPAEPSSERTPWSILIELSASQEKLDLTGDLSEFLATRMPQPIRTAVIAQSETQAANLRQLRENISEAQRPAGASIKHDIAVPIDRIPHFLNEVGPMIERCCPGARIVAFGHVGDGNLHYNISQPIGADAAEFRAAAPAINDIVYAAIDRLDGSFSAEHGVGLLRLPEMARYKSPVALDLMRSLKQALDPLNLLNPGKVIPPL